MGDLYASPSSRIFYPPVRYRHLRLEIVPRVKRLYLFALVGWFTLSGMDLVLALLSNFNERPGFAPPFALLGLVFLSEYRALGIHGHSLFERALFVAQLNRSRCIARSSVVAASVAAIAFAIQSFLTSRFGSFESVIDTFGLIARASFSAEPYRLLLGPFFHSGVAHLSNNLALGAGGLLIASSIGARPWVLLALFFLANALGAFIQLRSGLGQQFDAYLGVSAGVLSFYGMAWAYAYREAKALPRGLGTVILSIALISIVGAETLSPVAATAAHVVGLGLGMVFGALLACARQAVGPATTAQ